MLYGINLNISKGDLLWGSQRHEDCKGIVAAPTQDNTHKRVFLDTST